MRLLILILISILFELRNSILDRDYYDYLCALSNLLKNYQLVLLPRWYVKHLEDYQKNIIQTETQNQKIDSKR